jgi:hypothetical protein
MLSQPGSEQLEKQNKWIHLTHIAVAIGTVSRIRISPSPDISWQKKTTPCFSEQTGLCSGVRNDCANNSKCWRHPPIVLGEEFDRNYETFVIY